VIRHIKEVIIFFLLCGGINFYFYPHDPAFISFRLHPFLFATILFAIRYGIWEGMLSALLGAGAIIWATFQKNTMLEMEILYGVEHLDLPLLILFLGILIGEITESRIKKTSYYQSALKREVSASMSKTKANMGLEESLLEMEKKLAGHTLGIRNFSDELVTFMEKERAELYQDLPKLLETFLKVKKSCVFVANPNLHNPKLISGLDKDMGEAELNEILQHPIYLKAINERRAVSMTELVSKDHEELLKDHPIFFVGPILSDDASVDAMVLVLDIGFINFNITNFRLFEVILKSASMVIKNQMTYERLKKASPYHPQWLVERSHYFYKQLPDHLMMCQYDVPKLLIAGFVFGDHTSKNK
jgi:hypothetical protein